MSHSQSQMDQGLSTITQQTEEGALGLIQYDAHYRWNQASSE
eukprot:CAMPEP_0116946970 /NCGR_PEP_ID=MMETSP0467-20121206/37358_1 /TAXON_ID=283647 /ORGANISM="Mesodinium pulex, Strain SPMC105" /LENGTH=41 /DNA_ID= /DNA_START= /DNA_END= /DNA_ORIENTATION=